MHCQHIERWCGLRAPRSVAWAMMVLLMVFSPLAAEDNGEQTLEELVAILQSVANTPRGPATSEEDARNFEMLRQGVPQLQSHLQRGDYANARRIVRSWTRQTKSEALTQLCHTLIEHLEKKLDETETPLIDRADDLLAEATELCRTAADAADLNMISDALFEFRNFELGQAQASRTMQRVRQRLDGAIRFVEMYQQYLEAHSSEEWGQALQALSQLGQSHFGRGSMRLLSAGELAQRRREVERELYALTTTALEEIAHAFTAQTTLEELQELQTRLDDLYHHVNVGSGISSLRSRLDRSRNTLQAWMGLLLAEANDDVQGAMEQLRSMQEARHYDARLITSTLLLAKHKALAEKMQNDAGEQDLVAPLLDDIRSAEVLAERRAQLDLMRFSAITSTARREMDALGNELDQIAALYRALEDERYEPIWLQATAMPPSHSSHRWQLQTMQMRQAVVRQAIARFAGLSAFEPAHRQESAAMGLLRLADEAAATDDWPLVHQLLDVYTMAFARQTQPAWLTGELTACRAYLAGLQLEQFNQRDQAIESYLTVLKQIGERVPRKQTAERLSALQNQ